MFVSVIFNRYHATQLVNPDLNTTTPLIEILTFRGPPRFSLQDTHWTLSAEGFRVTRKCFGLGWVGGGLGAQVKVQDSFPNDGLGTHWSAGSRHTQHANLQSLRKQVVFQQGRGWGNAGRGLPQHRGLEAVYRVVEEIYFHLVECRLPQQLAHHFSVFRVWWFPAFQDFCDFLSPGFYDLCKSGGRGMCEELGAWVSQLSGLGRCSDSGNRGFSDFRILQF